MKRAWVDLDPEDVHTLLISLIGYRFGEQPEQHIDAIKAERQSYALKFVKLAGVQQYHTVLDLGAGCGFGTAEIARHVGRIRACDISPAFLGFARLVCTGIEYQEFHQTEPGRLDPIGDACVDVIIAMSLFIHLNLYDMHAYFRGFQRVLKPRGKVVFDFADAHGLFSRIRTSANDALFREHSGYYRKNPAVIAELVQWTSARAITRVARDVGFKRLKRRGQKLVLERRQ